MKFHFDHAPPYDPQHPIIFDWEDGVVTGPGADVIAQDVAALAGMTVGPPCPYDLWGYPVSKDPIKAPEDMAAILMMLFDWIPPELAPHFKPVYYDSLQFDEDGSELIY
jgi:hypothetical protein